MKQKFLNLSSIICIFLFIFFTAGCQTLPQGDKPQLLVPQNLKIDEETKVLTWDEVRNATSYKVYVYVDDFCRETFDAEPGVSLSFLKPGIYDIAVKAIGDLTLYSPSALSEKIPFVVEEEKEEEKIPLTTPQNVKAEFIKDLNSLQITFDSAADYVNASGYQVYVYEGDELLKIYTINANGDYLSLNEIINGTYTLKVAAITENVLYTTSELSEVVEFTVDDNSNDGLVLTGYYQNANGLIGDELEDALTAIITSTHKVNTTYAYLRTLLQDTDEDPNNKDNIILFYVRESVKSTWDQGNTWNREHVWPKSHGSLGESGPGADAHMLRASDPVVNSTRGNKKMGEVTNGTALKFGKKIVGYYTGSTFEPLDEVKGDVARIYFYMLVRYPNLYSSFYKVADLDVMLEWNELDPVDNLEVHRNEEVYKYQGNRNPFIDHPELADLIWNLK